MLRIKALHTELVVNTLPSISVFRCDCGCGVSSYSIYHHPLPSMLNHFKGNKGKLTSERRVGAHMGFSKRVDTILNWTELALSKGRTQSVVSNSNLVQKSKETALTERGRHPYMSGTSLTKLFHVEMLNCFVCGCPVFFWWVTFLVLSRLVCSEFLFMFLPRWWFSAKLYFILFHQWEKLQNKRDKAQIMLMRHI